MIIDVESLMKASHNKSRLVEVDVFVKVSFDAKHPFAPNHNLEILGKQDSKFHYEEAH